MSIFTPLFFYFLANPAYAEDTPQETIDLQGTWVLDVKASLNRCFRLEMHDCKGKDRAVVEQKMQADIDKKGTFSVAFQGQSIKVTFGDQSDQKTYSFVHQGYSYAVINIEQEDRSPETLVFIKDAPGVICMGENFPKSDTLCLRKKP